MERSQAPNRLDGVIRLIRFGVVTLFCAVSVVRTPAASAQQLPAETEDSRDEAPAQVDAQKEPAGPAKKTKAKRKEKGTQVEKRSASGRDDGTRTKRAKHPSLTIGQALTVEVTARIEADLRRATPVMGLENGQADWQDRRLGIQGTGFKRIEFEVSRELGQDFEQALGLREKSAWRNVYADARITKALNLEIGQFKLPFGREELTGETNLDFAYRSLAARVLSPGRDPGMMAHGRVLGRRLEYQVGYFTRDGMNGRTSQTEGGHDARVARLVVRPFAGLSAAAVAPLEIGAAVAESRFDNQLGIRGRTVLGDGVFFDRVYVNGQQLRRGLEAAWAAGPVGLSTEYVDLSEERTGMGFAGDDLPPVHAAAWYVAGTWALTGEPKHGRLEPKRDVLRGGFGALEIAARIETFRFDAVSYPTSAFGFPNPSKLRANADRVATFGINWYLNHYVKVQANLIREAIDDPDRSPAPSGDGRFTSAVIRLQFRL